MTDGHGPPRWPEDVLYLPVASADADDPKAPDFSEVSTWSSDGKGCYTHEQKYDRRWAIVDVDVEGYRLLIIDLDLYKLDGDEKQEVLNGVEKAPDTRVHKSTSGGKHHFYWIKERELTAPYTCGKCGEEFYDQADADEHQQKAGHEVAERDVKLPVTLETAIDDKLNGYVLSPDCEGYEVEEDREPVEITVSDLPDEWIDTSKEAEKVDGFRDDPAPRDDDAPSVFDVISSTYTEGERTEHPMGASHSDGGRSDTGTNFMVDEGGETWRCWRHGVTGNAFHLVGMQEGIIDCGDWKHSHIPTEKWRAIFEAAEERGIIEPSYIEEEDERTAKAGALEEREQYDSIVDAEIPDDGTSFVLDKPPREGGSYATMKHFTESGDPFVVLGSRHKILDYHVETIRELITDEMCAVHLEGSHRACEYDGDGQCPRTPDNYQEKGAMETDVNQAIMRKKTLTADDAPDDICPAWFLKNAAKKAHVIITVPQLLPKVDRDFHGVNLLIDEEQTLDFFRPGSVELAEISRIVETDGTTTVTQAGKNISKQAATLHSILDDVREEQEKRKEDGDSDNWRRTPAEKAIEESVEVVEEIEEALGTTEIREELVADGETPNLQNVIDIIDDRLNDIDLPETNADPDRLRENIDEYCAPYFWDDAADPSGVIESLLWPYEDHTFHFKRTGNWSYKLRIIGDKGREPFYADLLREFNQIGIIAGPQGERLLDDLGKESKSITITDFRYKDDFIVLPMGRERDGEMEPVGKQRDRVREVSKNLNAMNKPHISVAGTKQQAYNLAKDLTEEAADVVGDPDSPAKSLMGLWTTGSTAVIYENSVVSRGIDVPFFDVTTLVSPGFATPYWEARKEHYKGEDRAEYAKALAVESELKAREMTNAALRMATTRDVEDVTGTKIIVVASSDAKRKLKYLRDRMLEPVASPEKATRIVDALTAGGEMEVAMQDVLDELGGSEKQFIPVALTEDVGVAGRERPSFSLSEVREWVGAGYITSEYPFEKMERVARRSDVGRDELVSMASVAGESAEVVAEILSRKGIVSE